MVGVLAGGTQRGVEAPYRLERGAPHDATTHRVDGAPMRHRGVSVAADAQAGCHRPCGPATEAISPNRIPVSPHHVDTRLIEELDRCRHVVDGVRGMGVPAHEDVARRHGCGEVETG